MAGLRRNQWPLSVGLRNNAEHILFGVRGNLRTRDRSLPKAFEAPVCGGHSAKPDKFYEIVRAASYPTFGELFQVKPHLDFVNLHHSLPQGIAFAA